MLVGIDLTALAALPGRRGTGLDVVPVRGPYPSPHWNIPMLTLLLYDTHRRVAALFLFFYAAMC
ncbi:MAG: hypothetical protein OER86_03625 [Phycisphaerae bacterium]|nr:hypothetical protein [Phycisphaerae bacterium]